MNFEEAANIVRELSIYDKSGSKSRHDGANIIAQDANYIRTIFADSRLTKQDRFRQLMSIVTILADIARERFETFSQESEDSASFFEPDFDEDLRMGYEISAEMLADLIEEMRSISKRISKE